MVAISSFPFHGIRAGSRYGLCSDSRRRPADRHGRGYWRGMRGDSTSLGYLIYDLYFLLRQATLAGLGFPLGDGCTRDEGRVIFCARNRALHCIGTGLLYRKIIAYCGIITPNFWEMG